MTIKEEYRRIADKSTSEGIRVAGKGDICAIRQIWHDIFTTDEAYLDIIFNSLYPLLDAFVYTIAGKIVSVAFAIPITLVQKDEATTNLTTESSKIMESGCNSTCECLNKSTKRLNGRYLYGVATIEEARGKGLSRKLVKQIREHYTAAGEDFIITRPAEESLFSFYKSQGFTQSLYRREITICNSTASQNRSESNSPVFYSSDNIQEIQSRLDAAKLYTLRKDIYRNYFEWSSPILECIIKLARAEDNLIKYYPDKEKYFIAHYESRSENSANPDIISQTQTANQYTRLVVEETNFNSFEELLIHIDTAVKNNNDGAKSNCEFAMIPKEIVLLLPSRGDYWLSEHRTNVNKIKENVTEFALCMPLSNEMATVLTSECFFNFTME